MLIPPGWRGDTAFLVRDGRPVLSWGKEKQRMMRTERARRAMSGASGADGTGTRWHRAYCCGKRWKDCRLLHIYCSSVCLLRVPSQHLAPALFVFVHTSGRSVRGKRAEGQITSTLCLDFDKYLLATGSIPFHFTNKLEIHWLLYCFTEPSSFHLHVSGTGF